MSDSIHDDSKQDRDGVLSLAECEARAKQDGFDRATFDLCGPAGRLPCKWMDAYFGAFTTEGTEGFMMTRDFTDSGVWCENFKAPAK